MLLQGPIVLRSRTSGEKVMRGLRIDGPIAYVLGIVSVLGASTYSKINIHELLALSCHQFHILGNMINWQTSEITYASVLSYKPGTRRAQHWTRSKLCIALGPVQVLASFILNYYS